MIWSFKWEDFGNIFQNLPILGKMLILFGVVFSKNFIDRDFVGNSRCDSAVGKLFMIFSALYSAGQLDSLPYSAVFYKPSVSAPGYTGYVVGFIIGSIDRDKDIAYFSLKRRRTVNRGLAYVAV